MIPLKVLTLIVTNPTHPAALVMQPIEDSPKGKSRILPIWIGPAEAMQVGVSLEGIRPPRPTTHDLMLDAITNLDARIDHMVIHDLKGLTFFTKLCLRQGSRLIELDARPSDAVSLASRQGVPMYVEESVLAKGSFPYIVRDETSEEEIAQFHSFIESISPEDFEA